MRRSSPITGDHSNIDCRWAAEMISWIIKLYNSIVAYNAMLLFKYNGVGTSVRRVGNRSRGVEAENGLLPFSEGAGIWARRSSLRRRQARFSRFHPQLRLKRQWFRLVAETGTGKKNSCVRPIFFFKSYTVLAALRAPCRVFYFTEVGPR
jgi:hypothetical protein